MGIDRPGAGDRPGEDRDRPRETGELWSPRRAAAWEVADLTRRLLPGGHVKEPFETPFGTRYTVINGFIGPNGRNANLMTGWLIDGERDRRYPRLVTAWVKPHRNKEA